MTAVEVATKTCTACGETKPLGDFYRNRGAKDGRDHRCRPCALTASKAWRDEERERMGDEAWRAYQAENVARYRRKPEARKRNRIQTKAYRSAERRLREAHPDEFAALLRQERHALGLNVTTERTRT